MKKDLLNMQFFITLHTQSFLYKKYISSFTRVN